MTTFTGNPNELVRLVPQLRNTRHVRFNAEGKITTDNPKLIARLSRKFRAEEETVDSAKSYRCDKCEFTDANKGVLLAHKKTEHPKEG